MVRMTCFRSSFPGAFCELLSCFVLYKSNFCFVCCAVSFLWAPSRTGGFVCIRARSLSGVVFL